MAQILFGLQSLFSLWMLVDAIQRGAARYWYPVILLPFGEVAYFLSVKVHDPEFRRMRLFFQNIFAPKLTLEALRYQAKETPSFANKLLLAQGLFDADVQDEAATAFQELLTIDNESKDALYGFALCAIEAGDDEQAMEALRCLIEIKPSFHDYDGWAKLAETLRRTDQLPEAIDVLTTLVKKAPRLPHRVMLARYLGYSQRREDARDQLEIGLKALEHAPRFQQRQESAAARDARTMLQQMDGK
jgi:hypothetical protein